MKIKHIIHSSLLFLLIPAGLNASTSAPKTVEITANDTMKYSVTKIEAQPGQKMTVELKSEGNVPKEAMAHNWVLLKAGTNVAAYAAAALTAKADNYRPKSLENEVLASIPLLGPKESGKVSFAAPTAPGNYAYLCSSPGHLQAGMTGVLIVK